LIEQIRATKRIFYVYSQTTNEQMKISHLLYLASIVCILSFQNSCVKEKYDTDKTVANYSPELAIPLAHSIFTVDKILKHTSDSTLGEHDHLSSDIDGLITLLYRDTLFSKTASDFLPIVFPPSGIITGYVGPDSAVLDVDSIDLNLELYNKVVGGSFYFEDPKMYVYVTNSFGLPIQMTLLTLEAWSPINGTVQIELNGSPAPIILSPTPSFPLTPGASAVTSYLFDDNNSNIKNFLSIGPKYIYYSVKGVTNTPPTSPNFITDSSKFSVEVLVELPLYGNANYLVLGDTLPFDLGINNPSGSDITAKSATFIINTYNGFPCDVFMQLLFADANGIIIDSLFTTGESQAISSGVIGPAPGLRVMAPTHTITEIYVDNDRLDKIGSATRVVIKGRLTTSSLGVPMVKVYSDYIIEVKLAVRAELFFGSQ